jgi:outer membrane protein assembly factor BamB
MRHEPELRSKPACLAQRRKGAKGFAPQTPGWFSSSRNWFLRFRLCVLATWREFNFGFRDEFRTGVAGSWIGSALLSYLLLHFSCFASDWPQLLGPNRDGVYPGDDLAASWPADGPRVLWRAKIGHGFAAPSVAEGKVVLFHRVGDEEVIEAFDAANGKSLWKFNYPATYRDDFGFDPGPRATPTIAGGKVFTFGADGMLTCVALADGRKVWSVDCKQEFAAPKGFFGLACSPLVEGNAVIVNVGGKPNASIVSFNQDKGSVLWRALEDEPGYSSPVAATLDGRRTLLVLTRSFFIGCEAASGKELFRHPFRPPVNASVTGATPAVAGDSIFITAAYDLGAVAFRAKAGQLEKLWSGDEQLSLQFTSPVHRDGFLYGLHGRHDFPGGTELRCIELATGKVRWAKTGLAGANVILAGDSLLLLSENGELLRLAAGPDQFRELARAQILGRGVRAYPALANGLLYARDKAQLVCVDLK